MNFLQNRSLKQLALGVLGSLFLIFVVEFIIIRAQIEKLEEIEAKKDFARGAQIEGQQTAYLIQQHISGQPGLTAEIYTRITDLDHKLKTLNTGGRTGTRDIFIKPLSRLPAITFRKLFESWQVYQANALSLIDRQPAASQQADTTRSQPDSLAMVTSRAGNTNLIAGQWLALSNWYEKLMVDLSEEADARKNEVGSLFIFFAVIDLLLLGLLYFLFWKYVLTPLQTLKQNVSTYQQDQTFAKNEMGELASEVNEILEQLKDATEFVAAIGEGRLDFDYKTLDKTYASGKNRLADSLINMQEKLKTLNEEEHRRQWANEGLTRFVDILRSSNDNISTLGDKIISALVKYTNANQGGLYILNDEDERNKHLELISLFAFDNKKFETQKLKLGEGILGQTFLEKETTILNDIPGEYVRITSGLGGATPKSLLIVPLKVDKDVYGIVELASFRNFQAHEIAFVEKLAETIASTLASVKVAQKNRHLIEQFQQQTEEMRAQEEEMRQNMEELQATQEEISRKEQDYIVRIRELETQLHSRVDTEEHAKVKEELNRKQSEYQSKLRELESKLAQKPQREDDWAMADEVEKTLRVQLESLRITHEEISKKEENRNTGRGN